MNKIIYIPNSKTLKLDRFNAANIIGYRLFSNDENQIAIETTNDEYIYPYSEELFHGHRLSNNALLYIDASFQAPNGKISEDQAEGMGFAEYSY